MLTQSGIYKIINMLDGSFYIGSSTNMSARWSNHKKKSVLGYNNCPHLYSAIRKYGIDNFKCIPLLVCDAHMLEYYEQKLLDMYYGLCECYNASPNAIAPWRSRKMSNAARNNISLAMRGKPAWNRGIPRTTAEKKKIRAQTLKITPLAIPETEFKNVKQMYFIHNMTFKEIAEYYNVSYSTPRRILLSYKKDERRGRRIRNKTKFIQREI